MFRAESSPLNYAFATVNRTRYGRLNRADIVWISVILPAPVVGLAHPTVVYRQAATFYQASAPDILSRRMHTFRIAVESESPVVVWTVAANRSYLPASDYGAYHEPTQLPSSSHTN